MHRSIFCHKISQQKYIEDHITYFSLVTGICPKCGKKGSQHIHTDGKDSTRHYLEYVHFSDSGKKSSCHIGRVRTSVEALEEFNEEN